MQVSSLLSSVLLFPGAYTSSCECLFLLINSFLLGCCCGHSVLNIFLNTSLLCFSSYGRAKQRYARGSRDDDEKLSPALHLASAAEAGALVCITN